MSDSIQSGDPATLLGGGKNKKKAPSAYNKFMAKEYKRIKAENPNLKATDIFKKAAANWKKQK